MSAVPADHVPVDWSKWSPPGEGDVRSPCPAINALCNHGILPRNGKNLSKPIVVQALTEALHLDGNIAKVFAAGGVASNPDHHAHTFDMNNVDKHGFIEHDVSLSREDIAFGSNAAFSKVRFDEFFQTLKSHVDAEASSSTPSTEGHTTWKAAAQARLSRMLESKARHEKEGKQFTYGVKEAVMSYGETSLYLNLLGNDGVAPLEWVRIFFEEERLPYAEGWRPPAVFNQAKLNHGYTQMLRSGGLTGEEARAVGLGTLEALETVVSSFVKDITPAWCTIM